MIRYSKKIKEEVLNFRWGAYSITALYLSLLSGVIVSLQYDPATPYYSTNSIDVMVPYGKFWRSLHFYSSQIFFLLSLVHLFVLIAKKRHWKIPARNWSLLVGSLAVSLLVLFTGYILRGDATGSFAGIIAENIILSVPLFGDGLNSLLFSIGEVGMRRVYSNHMVGLCLLWLFMSWNHIRFYTISWSSNAGFSLVVLLFCVWFDAPMEPEKIGVFQVNGPWFFIGLQETLRYIQPFWAGIVFPASLVVALFFMNRGGVVEKMSRYFVLGWLTIYLCLTMLGLF